MEKDDIIVIIIISVVIVWLFVGAFLLIKGFIGGILSDYNHYKEIYDFSSAIVIDTHIGYSRFGTPCYYFVYEFSSGAIKQVQVHEEEYYKYLSENFPEGS